LLRATGTPTAQEIHRRRHRYPIHVGRRNLLDLLTSRTRTRAPEPNPNLLKDILEVRVRQAMLEPDPTDQRGKPSDRRFQLRGNPVQRNHTVLNVGGGPGEDNAGA
jgi:hypothetical protein